MRRCPRCGRTADTMSRVERPVEGGGTISFSVASSGTSSPSQQTPDWRDELKQKLQQHQLKKHGAVPPAHDPDRVRPTPAAKLRLRRRKPPPERPAGPDPRRYRPADEPEPLVVKEPTLESRPPAPNAKAPGEMVKQLFKYKLEDVGKLRDRRIITFSKSKPAPAPPRVEPPAAPPPPARVEEPDDEGAPLQRRLVLEASAEPPPPSEAAAEPAPPPRHTPSVVEVLFSRLLAGIVDVVLAGALGLLFASLAARLAGTDFPSVEGLLVAAGCAWVLLVLNEVFFLFTLRRTPGMMWTELRLVGESSTTPGFGAILTRAVLWIPVALTLVGLAWALVDSEGRCLHDRLSQTRVVPS